MYLKPQNGRVTLSTPKSFVAEDVGQHQPPKDNGLLKVVLGNNKDEAEKIQLHCEELSSFVAGRWPAAGTGSSELLSSLLSGNADDKDGEVEDPAHRKTSKNCSPAHQKGFSDPEEIEKRFETLSFAFKTDSSTIEKRLNLLKRKRDQAEINVRNEVGTIRDKLKELEHFASGVDVDHYNAMLDVKKELDHLLRAASQLTSGAEDYGYVQHEKKTLDFVAVMVQHVDNLAARRKDTFKSLDGLQTESERFCACEVSPTNLDDDDDRNDIKSCSNKSVGVRASQQWSATVVPASTSTATAGAMVPFEGHCRRRASITAFPRTVPARAVPTVSAPSAIDFAHSRRNGLADDVDSGGENAKDESQSSVHGKRQFPMRPGRDCGKYSGFHETASVRKRTEPQSESSRYSISPESHTCRRLIRETFQLIRSQVPGSLRRNHFQFYLTWTTVFVVILLTFLIGFCLGFQGYFVRSGSRCLFAWIAVLTFCMILQRFYRVLIGLIVASALLLVALILWLGKSLPRSWTAEEIDRLLRAFGMEVEVRYRGGPPPV